MVTANEIIKKVDEYKPNQYSDSVKLDWLSELDAKIIEEIINTHEDSEVIDDLVENNEYDYPPYTNQECILLVESPYSDMYIHYLFAKIDYYNAEYARYNNSMSMFNQEYSEYFNYYNKKHKPLQPIIRGVK